LTLSPSRIAAVALLAAAAAVAIAPAPEGVTQREMWAAAAAFSAIALLATQALPEHVTAIGFLALASATGLARPEVVFAGFHSSVLWLLFSGTVIGLALDHTGLAARLAGRLLGGRGLTFAQAVWALLAASLALAFVMPATVARILILMPIALALADRLGFREGSRGRTGLALTVAFGAYMPTYGILPSNLPNVVIVGGAETLYGLRITYGEYLLWHFPVIGVLKSLAIVALILHWYRDEANAVQGDTAPPQGPLTPAQKRLACVIFATVALWMTDFAHHVSPGWVALAAAAIILVPGAGLTPPAPFAGKLNLGMIFYLAGVLGIGAVLADSGAGALIARTLIGWIGLVPGNPGASYAALTAFASLLGQALTSPAAAVVLMPLAQELATAAGLPLKTVLMTQLFGISIVWLPYVAPPLVVALALGKVGTPEAIRFCIVMSLLTVFLLAPVNWLLWRALGII